MSPSEHVVSFDAATAELVHQALHAVVRRLYSETDKLNRFDAVAGDGDTGTAFSRVADAISRDLTNKKLVLDRPSSLFRRLGLIGESRMGGTSGASNSSFVVFPFVPVFFQFAACSSLLRRNICR